MKIPPLLIGLCLIFWGLETERLFLGLPLALLLEGRVLVKSRYDFEREDFVRLSDLTSLIFLAAVTLILLNFEARSFLRITATWLPVILIPLVVGQLYSTGDTVIIGTRLGGRKKNYSHNPFDIRVPYIVVCLFASACANSGSSLFLPLTGVILFILFFFNRGQGFSPLVPFLVFVALFGAAFLLSQGMEQGQRYVSYKAMRMFRDYYRDKYQDPFISAVSFGDTGRLKDSGQIVMRVKASGAPPLLKMADYSTYSEGKWFGNYKSYTYLLPVDGETWQLQPESDGGGEKLVAEYDLPREKGVVPLPMGSYSLQSKTIYELEQNGSGNLRVTDGAPVITYEVTYHPRKGGNEPPLGVRYLIVPVEERYVFDPLAEQLAGGDAMARVEKVKRYFQSGFTYSLSLLGKGQYRTPLGNFLLQKKSGFCEYYATATALLLRSLGVPSRYVVGFAVVERSGLEGKYVVRKRHAHAWVEAFVDGRWITVDTTPGQWAAVDSAKASLMQPLSDFFAFLRHKYQLYRIGSGADYTLYFSIVVVLLTLFLVIRISRRMRVARQDEQGKKKRKTFARIITPFTPLMESLRERKDMEEGEISFVMWAEAAHNWQNFNRQEFEMLYRLHLKMRFDPEGLSQKDEALLRQGVARYLHDLETAPQS